MVRNRFIPHFSSSQRRTFSLTRTSPLQGTLPSRTTTQSLIPSLLFPFFKHNSLWLRRLTTQLSHQQKEIVTKKRKVDFLDRTKNVFVGNLTPSTTRGLLLHHILLSGFKPINAKILHKDDGSSKCCGVVTFESAKDALRAIHSLHGTAIDGRNILVKVDEPESARGYYKPKESSPHVDTNTTLFVTNISYHVTEAQLRELFSKVGDVQTLKYFTSSAGQPRGRAMLKFQDKQCAADAILRLNGQVFERRRIYVRYCNPL